MLGASPFTVVPPPREMDPQMLPWKGGSIFCRLKLSNESWISRTEWDFIGYRALQTHNAFSF